MTFSSEWETLYNDNAHMSVWPWTDLVSHIHRYAHPAKGYWKVLELGTGAGANVPLFLKLGAEYWGIEGSPSIVDRVVSAYPQIRDRLVAADFTHDIPFPGPFDLVVDRVSLPHNDTVAIAGTLQRVFDLLRPGGKFIGIDWFSDRHSDALRGERVDAHTRRALPPDSHLSGTGVVHFCSQEHLSSLLTEVGFRVERLEHKVRETVVPGGAVLAWWDFVARKD